MSEAHAGLIEKKFSGSDCSGYFGQGFGACEIYIGEDNNRIELSPVIAKFEFAEDGTENTGERETNSLYDTVDGTEFSWTGTSSTSGSWEYDTGEGDPAVKYWAAKGSNFFNLFWEVPDAAVAPDGDCAEGDPYTLACLEQALAQTSNTWSTPNGAGLSHLTFYDTEAPEEPPVTEISAPAAFGLLGTALMMLGIVAARYPRDRKAS
ncbi:hypothetical protein [Rhodovibrio sodomensis]|uniref:hypothetical protein n=1 Tax=Rhodovibrio sodomensis TaxID=1088 RepID=UPI001908F0BA|nr:hypothetical protein [Rhodovibrio sodomensis]